MSDDSKDWVNIRIEEPVRDDARADDRTYTEIMADGLAADRGERASGDTHSDAEGFDVDLDEELSADLPDDLREQLDRIEDAATTAEERAGRVERTLEDMGAGR